MRTYILQAWKGRGPVALMLLPVALIYRLLLWFRQVGFALGWCQSQAAEVPVIVIGNVVAGGAGKTPVVMAIVEHLRLAGWHVGVIARGYGRKTTDCREALATSDPLDVGDEALLIRKTTGVPTWVASKRLDAARALLVKYPDTDILISDDGLQHLALRPDVCICVFDDRGLGNGWLLPAGPLREPWPRAVDLVLSPVSIARGPSVHAVRRVLAGWAERADGTRLPLESLRHLPLVATAGIARPEQFFGMLRGAGLSLNRSLPMPDHADFAAFAPGLQGEEILVCTQKDAAKLWQRFPQALAVPLQVDMDDPFWQRLDELAQRLRRTQLSSVAKP